MSAGTAGPGTARPGTGEASASWQALGTGAQVTVTDASQLAAARGMLEADLAAIDLACSRFRPDSEIVALDRAMGGSGAAGGRARRRPGSAHCSRRRSRSRCGRPGSPMGTSIRPWAPP